MIKKSIRHLVANENEKIADVYWRFKKEPLITIVADENEKYLGIVAEFDYNMAGLTEGRGLIKSIMNRNATVIRTGREDIYSQARNIFSEKDINVVPVISEQGDILDIFTRQRAFFKQRYIDGRLERMNYAVCIYAAAKEASELGVASISICEFGVAGGRGLLAAQFYAREIGRLTGVDIHVYGFDLGTGIPRTNEPTMDLAHWFFPGAFDTSMNKGRLTDRLYEENELILGDIKDTITGFFDSHNDPVGAVFVDVDLYTSTKYILDWAKKHSNDHCFLPRVFMYFDDVHGLLEGLGEHKAILEFNKEMESDMRISPEGAGTISDLHYLDAACGVYSKWLYSAQQSYTYGRIKICHRFRDDRYNNNSFLDRKRNKIIMKPMAMI